VVILDVKMPGMEDIETLREIKKKRRLIEVIMLNGHATVETGVEGMKLGAFDYLMKPCDIEQLLTKVRQAKEPKIKHEEKVTQARIQEIAFR
jgi:DNA-binding NtrC family response regulator